MQYIHQKCRLLCYLLILVITIEGIPLTVARAQDKVEVSNVRFQVSGKLIIINYDLQGPADREYRIGVTLKRKKDQTFQYTPISAEGDIGEECHIGNNKQIVWDMSKEFQQDLDADNSFFLVKAELIPERSNTWWYITGGAAIVGGAVVYLLTKGGRETSSIDQAFPKPIGRPTGN